MTSNTADEQAIETPAPEPKKALDPRVFRPNMINPMTIYGMDDFVNERTDHLRDHPDFPNPRSKHNMDMGVVEDISQTGELWAPVDLYWPADGSIILADGKTRMTGIGLYLRKHKNLIGKLEVALNRLKGADNEIRLIMLRQNLKHAKRPLTDPDVSLYLRELDRKGVTQDEQLRALDKSGRKGLIWLNHMKVILDANPAVVDAYHGGEIEFTTAKMIAKSEFHAQPAMLAKVRELKAGSDMNEAAIRKVAGVKKANRVTLGFDPTMAHLISEVYVPSAGHLLPDKDRQVKHKEISKAVREFLTEKGLTQEYDEMLHRESLLTAFETFMFFLRQTGGTLKDQIAFVRDHMSEEQLKKADENIESASAGAPIKKRTVKKGVVFAG